MLKTSTTAHAGFRVLNFYPQACYWLMLQEQSETGHNQSDTENICKYTKNRRWYQIQTERDTCAGERQSKVSGEGMKKPKSWDFF